MHLAKVLLTNALFLNGDHYRDGSWVEKGLVAATMGGFRRLDNIQWLLEDAILRGIPGDIIETGTWRGGMMLYAALLLQHLGDHRTVFLADSFSGIPKYTDERSTPQDRWSHSIALLRENSPSMVRSYIGRLPLPSVHFKFLVGLFNETLPRAFHKGAFKDGFAVVRLDGDTYHSTMDAITVLYPLLHRGGFLMVDDYLDWAGCNTAIEEYRSRYNITDPVVPVYHEGTEQVRGVWWMKT
jgi:hypothetical protein